MHVIFIAEKTMLSIWFYQFALDIFFNEIVCMFTKFHI